MDDQDGAVTPDDDALEHRTPPRRPLRKSHRGDAHRAWEHFTQALLANIVNTFDVITELALDSVGIVFIMGNMRALEWLSKLIMSESRELMVLEESRFQVPLEFVMRQIDISLIIGLAMITGFKILVHLIVSATSNHKRRLNSRG